MSSLTAARVVAPTHRSVPRARRSLGEDAVDLADLAGLHLDDWQADVLIDAMQVRARGKWAAFEVGLIVPRQNGKGSVLEARELHGLFCEPDTKLILHSAHEFKTAKEAFRRVVSLVEASPQLKKRVDHVRYTTGEEGIELKDGSRLKFVARSSGSGRGFSGDLIILDEAYNLSDDMMAALLPTMSARPNPQIWYTSSAPLPTLQSMVLRRLCRRGRDQVSPALAYFEWCATADDDPAAPGSWVKANPALGIRISDEFVERERQALGEEEFARERLGIWLDLEEGPPRVISAERWDACVSRSVAADPVALAFDVTPDRSAATVAAAGPSSIEGHRVHLEVVKHGQGTNWVVPLLVSLVEARGPVAVACDAGGPAGGLLSSVVAAGLDVIPVSAREHAQAAQGLLDGVVDEDVCHIGQGPLDEAVAGAQKRDLGDGAWLWSRKSSDVDISPLVAVTLAKWAWENAERPDATASVW